MTSTNLEELLIRANPVLDPEEVRLPTDDVNARCSAIVEDRRITILERRGVMPTATLTKKRAGVPPPSKRFRPAVAIGLGLLVVIVAVGGIAVLTDGEDRAGEPPAAAPTSPAMLDFSAIVGTWSGLLTFGEDQRTSWVELTLTSEAARNSEVGTVVYKASEDSTQATCEGLLLAAAAAHPTYQIFEATDPDDCYHGTIQLEYDPQARTLSYDQRDVTATASGMLTPSR